MELRDPYNLQRFVDAQEAIFDQVREELLDGRKKTWPPRGRSPTEHERKNYAYKLGYS